MTADLRPDTLRPMLAVAAARPPEGPDWCYELKWDGVRALAFVSAAGTRLFSRSGRDLTATYPELAGGRPLGGSTGVLDGEVVAFDEDGRPSFQALQSRLRAQRAGHRLAPLSYVLFDLLGLADEALLRSPYLERRRLLAGVELGNEAWCVPDAFPPPGGEVLEASRARGLEGVVAKLATSSYLPGRRSPAWVKVKNFRTQEVVLGGWTEGEGRRSSSLGSLLLGVPAGGGAAGLEYVGNVGTGFDDEALADLLARLGALERPTSPFAGRLPPLRGRRARFAEPELVGEVRFSEWTADGRLRQASWRGLRDDKSPGDVRREP